MKKLLAIRTPTYEPNCRFCCIDEFWKYGQFSNAYFCGIQIYEDFIKTPYENPKLRFGEKSEVNNLFEDNAWFYNPVKRNKNDVFEKPDITMYNTMGRLLMENGLVFNKKTGEIQKKKE